MTTRISIYLQMYVHILFLVAAKFRSEGFVAVKARRVRVETQ